MQLTIIIILVVLKVFGISIPPTWVTSNYVQASSKVIFSSFTPSGTVYTSTFTFGYSFSGLPKIGYGFKCYKGINLFYLGDDYTAP